MKIFLIGFMGCGKSTKAKQLAKSLGFPHFDTDALIEEAIGMPISAYFHLNGEEKFRAMEGQVLKTYPFPEQAIIATGGGLPCFYDHIDWMNQNGKTVYLEMTAKQLVSRLGNREKRPLIKDMDDLQLLHFIETKLQEREVYYKKAQITVSAFDLEISQLRQQLEL